MLGQFVIPTLHSLGLNVRGILRNTPRGIWDPKPLGQKDLETEVSIQIYHQGKAVLGEAKKVTIPYGGFYEISSENFPALNEPEEQLIIARCKLGDKPGYFPQEHQMLYLDKNKPNWASLIFDQIPVLTNNSPSAPIILIAPKIWVSQSINTYVIFSFVSDLPSNQAGKMVLNVITQSGEIIHTETKPEKYNDIWIFDSRAAVEGKLKLTDEPLCLNVTARGGTGSQVIFTCIRNDKTGSIALEHSLSPHYYFSGDRNRVRNEALIFPSVNL